MTKAQLAILPLNGGRKAERRIVNLAARLREWGARMIEVEVMNLSTDGFMARSPVPLEVGSCCWLKMPGVEPQNSRIIWVEEDKAGFEFASPLHPATLSEIVAIHRRPMVQNHFGPAGRR